MSASKPQTCWCEKSYRGIFEIEKRWRATRGSRDRPTKAALKRREGTCQGRQREGATWADSVSLALPDVPERQRVGAMVSARGRRAPSGARKTTMIVALARKLLIALWRLVTTGEVRDGVELRPAA